MVEKIIINPTKVRAYGNIVNVKSDEDYEPVDCTLTEDTDTVYGATVNVIVMEPDLGEATTLTVTSSSSTLVLDGTVTISATLKDSSNVAISGATITFKEGSTTLGTGTTNSSGVATYTYTGATTGSHTVSGVFGGDSTYASSTGSVGLTVNKKSTSTALTSSGSSVTVGTSVTLTATVTSGGVGVDGLTVLFKDGTSTLGTGTTNSSGVATYTTSALAEGTHSITAVVTETSTYSTSTSTAVTVTVSSSATVASVALTGTSNILSKYHNETCTLTATVLDTNSQPVNGETVTFYNGTTSMGTATTNASGVATKTYSSNGAGDVSFTAECSNITSSAYNVEDCIVYKEGELSRTSTYATDHVTPVFNDFSFTSDNYLFEADVKYTDQRIGICVEPNGKTDPYHHLLWAYSNDKQCFYIGKQTSGEEIYRYDTISANTYYSLKFTYENGTVTSYMGGTQKGQYTGKTYLNGETRNLYWYEWYSNITVTAKNIKIKPI